MILERRLVGPYEVEAIYELLKTCGQDMKIQLGLNHWIPPFPLELLRTDAQARRTYVVYNGEQLVATFTIGKQAPSYYLTSKELMEAWDISWEPALYINRLAVLPKLQKQGIGVWCMREIERIASDEQYFAVRLDAYKKNLPLIVWYKHLGYKVKGNFSLDRSSGAKNVTCMEKTRKDFIIL